MHQKLLQEFESQVLLQSQFVLFAAEQANDGVKRHDTRFTFYALQNLLNAAANISKALWGQGGKFSRERQPLRDSIGITDTSPLKQTDMRNNFEHFDERLYSWWIGSKTHGSVDLNISSRNGIAGFESLDWFRNYDPQTTELIFWSQDFNVGELVNEARRIVEKLQGNV